MAKPFAYSLMAERGDAIDRLDIQFRWGGYGFRVLRCHLATFAPGKIVRFHKHSEYEFHFIPRGKGTVILDDIVYPLQEGVFYLTGPNVLHQQEADAREAMDELCLHIDIVPMKESEDEASWGDPWERHEAESCINALNGLPLRPHVDQYNAMSWFLTAYRAWNEGQPGAFSTIKQAIIQILLRASRMSSEPSLTFEPPSRNMNEHRFRIATQFIHDNYAQPLTLQEVAERIPISARQLQRIFREQGEESFSAYLENHRLAQVCSAIVEGQHSIEHIALEHGFASSNYLYYVFKKRFNMTPRQFRIQHTSVNNSSEMDDH
ncbi:AraC-like DNA-binding protein [Paenibacillus taihuensis]|uniref:AraC-like DNA-binding protein n=1 Tax=Paenibacillus taihuensis TaxID=1156355 RepID=A0A3D9R3M0_9BACL|nr:AraC family transcriptional regulator [Paenibacillus taihuensis]REE70662.1 AraC-like DNA-binding protein [Paenibacillus taihuensis]